MRFLIVFCIFLISMSADVLQIRDFQTDIYSKASANATKKINLDLEVIGRDMEENEAYALDALNVVIGSFYIEDLLTSRGKEKLKETYIKYAAKKHAISIDTVLILGIKVVENLSLDQVISAIKERNLCSTNISSNDNTNQNSKSNEIIISPKIVNQKPIDLNSIKDFGKDFGD